jgi:hypothetical protein
MWPKIDTEVGREAQKPRWAFSWVPPWANLPAVSLFGWTSFWGADHTANELIFLVANAHQCVYSKRLIRLVLHKIFTFTCVLAWRVQKMEKRANLMVPLQPKELQQLEDARWARQDPDVLVQYPGEFVVPYKRKIVAHCEDAAVVLAEAAQITGRPADELPLVGVVDPLLDMPR